MENTFVANKYRIGPKIGCGSFGEVYLCTQQNTSVVYACKRENDKIKHSQLITQNKILKIMGQYVGFPKIQWYGSQNKSNYIVMQMLGPSLQDLFGICNKKFNLKTVLMLTDQFIQKMELLHSKHYIHRDIKPQNFLMGIGGNSHILHLIDFGLSKKYKDSKTQQHIPYKQNRSLTGTARYSSINTHLGMEQSRRDDLQSIGYVLVYFMKGSLPWQGIRANNKIQKYQKIMEKKMSIPVQVLCKGLPVQFSTYLNYCRSLKFEQKPDYLFLRRMFRDLFERVGFELDFQYSWSRLTQQTQFQTAKVQLQILKKGELIPLQQLLEPKQKNKIKFKDCLDEEDIQFDLANAPQNLLDDPLEESDMNLVKLQTNTNGNFIPKANKLLWE